VSRDGAEGYTTREVAEALGLPTSEIRAWTRGGVLAPMRDAKGEHRYSFQDVALLREARHLLDGPVPARRVRATLRSLRAQLPPGEPLSTLRMSVASGRVLVSDAERVWEPDSGQIFFDFWMGGAGPAGSGTADTAPTAVIAMSERAVPSARAPEGGTSKVGRGPTSEGRTADEWYDAALDLEASSAEQAEAAYRRALVVDPGHADAHLNMGRLLHERGLLVEAEEHYRAAAAAVPESAAARYNLGVVLEDLGRTMDAMAAYRDALTLDNGLAAAHFNLARLCEARGEEADAFAHLVAYKRLQVPDGRGGALD
jgi:DNA-binding transcriptional MerR regulator